MKYLLQYNKKIGKNWRKALIDQLALSPFLHFLNPKPWPGTQFITSLNVQEKTKPKSDFKNFGQL